MTYYFTNQIKKQMGNNLAKVRRQRKLMQIDVATDAGVDPSYYSKIERGEVNPSIEKLYRIMRALKVDSSEIFPF